MGVGLSGSAASGRTSSNGDQTRRYYNNPNSVNNVRGSKPTQYDWGLGGRNRSTSSGSQASHIAILDLTQIQAQAHRDLTVHQVVLLVAIPDRLLLHQVMQVFLHQVADPLVDL